MYKTHELVQDFVYIMYVCFNRSVRLATNDMLVFSSHVRSSVHQMEQKKNIFQFYCCFHCEGVTAMITRDMIEEAFVEMPLNIFGIQKDLVLSFHVSLLCDSLY